jgi:hypothetical protein
MLKKNNYNLDIICVGLTRNSEKTIEKEIETIKNSLKNFKKIYWIVIESDSNDKTLECLEKIKTKISNFEFKSLGKINKKFKFKSEKMAFLRNLYVNEINNNPQYEKIDYIIVADLDGVNMKLNAKSVESCWDMKVKWDACFANQSGKYYDIFALRHKIWSPNCCWESKNFLEKFGMNSGLSSFSAIYSRMINIPLDAKPIPVDSAFGGFGIYKKKTFVDNKYIGKNEKEIEQCEHVKFHLNMIKNKYELFINPKLINDSSNYHSNQILLILKFLFYLIFSNKILKKIKSIKNLIFQNSSF